MADPSIHLSVGFAAGTVVTIACVARTIKLDRPVSRTWTWCFAACCALALWGIAPALLHATGILSRESAPSWTNIFWFHAALNARKGGGSVIGASILAACFAAHYTTLLCAIHLRKRQRRNQ